MKIMSNLYYYKLYKKILQVKNIYKFYLRMDITSCLLLIQ
jgi:hypothetical protein